MNSHTFDLNLLVVFDALLNEGSVTRAARRVGLSQPAFSNALARLRAAVGDPLFARAGGGMVPTARAQAMARSVQSALADIHRALGLSLPADASSRAVTVAANDYACCLVLPAAIALLRRRAPDVRLAIEGEAASEPTDLTVKWADTAGPSRGTVLLRDSLVGVVARGRRQFGNAVIGRTSGFVMPALQAIALASAVGTVARVPSRLARRFSKVMALKTLELPGRKPMLTLELTGRADSALDPAVTAVRKSILDAAKRLTGGRAQ